MLGKKRSELKHLSNFVEKSTEIPFVVVSDCGIGL